MERLLFESLLLDLPRDDGVFEADFGGRPLFRPEGAGERLGGRPRFLPVELAVGWVFFGLPGFPGGRPGPRRVPEPGGRPGPRFFVVTSPVLVTPAFFLPLPDAFSAVFLGLPTVLVRELTLPVDFEDLQDGQNHATAGTFSSGGSRQKV